MDLKPIVVADVEQAKATVAILERETRLGIDCEGVNLGLDGEVTLIQIVTPSSDIYFFDVLVCPQIAPILKPILESQHILKVIVSFHVALLSLGNVSYTIQLQLLTLLSHFSV